MLHLKTMYLAKKMENKVKYNRKERKPKCLKQKYSISDAITEHQVNKFKYKPCLWGSSNYGKKLSQRKKINGLIFLFLSFFRSMKIK